MSMFDQLVALFTQHDAHFHVIEHPAEGRSDLVAEVRGTTVAQGAKAIVCEIEGAPLARYALAVVPGDRKVNIKAVAQLAGGPQGSLRQAGGR